LEQVEWAFGTATAQRRFLMRQLKRAYINFKMAGVKMIKLAGSFIGPKANPSDIDGCWVNSESVDLKKLRSFPEMRNRFTMKFDLELDFFECSQIELDTKLEFSDFFQKNRDDQPVGIIAIPISPE
jgi:hypothetical protein